jgi:hypothetical protein
MNIIKGAEDIYIIVFCKILHGQIKNCTTQMFGSLEKISMYYFMFLAYESSLWIFQILLLLQYFL